MTGSTQLEISGKWSDVRITGLPHGKYIENHKPPTSPKEVPVAKVSTLICIFQHCKTFAEGDEKRANTHGKQLLGRQSGLRWRHFPSWHVLSGVHPVHMCPPMITDDSYQGVSLRHGNRVYVTWAGLELTFVDQASLSTQRSFWLCFSREWIKSLCHHDWLFIIILA